MLYLLDSAVPALWHLVLFLSYHRVTAFQFSSDGWGCSCLQVLLESAGLVVTELGTEILMSRAGCKCLEVRVRVLCCWGTMTGTGGPVLSIIVFLSWFQEMAGVRTLEPQLLFMLHRRAGCNTRFSQQRKAVSL